VPRASQAALPGLADKGSRRRIRTDKDRVIMEESQVVSVERTREGVVIEFEDGKCAIYTASLLLAHYHEAIKVNESDGGGGDPEG
jgi:hypothetical protein